MGLPDFVFLSVSYGIDLSFSCSSTTQSAYNHIYGIMSRYCNKSTLSTPACAFNHGRLSPHLPNSIQQVCRLNCKTLLDSSIAQTAGMDALFRKLQHGFLLLWRWLLPGLSALSCWLLLLCPHKVSVFVPSLQSPWLLGGPPAQHKAATLPSSRSAVYQLGYISGKLSSWEADSTALQTAANVLSLPEGAVTVGLMASLGQAYHEVDHVRSGAWVFGLFNFLNFIWCLSIVGISVSAAPVVLTIAQPLKRFMRTHAQPFISVLHRCAIALQPAFQAVLFWLCFYIIAAAARYPTSYNHFIALSGCIMSLPSFFWTVMPRTAAEAESQMMFCYTFLWVVLAPVTAVYNSLLIGCLSSAALFGALGLSKVPHDQSWNAGFSSFSNLHRVAGISCLILSILVIARAVGVESAVLQPLQAGFFVFGSIWLFSACLIETSRYYMSSNTYFLIANLRFLLVLLLSTLVGAVFHLASLQNTGIICTLVWAMVKIVELSILGRCTWVGVFLMSLVSWQLALWLHSHPEFVQALFW